MSYQVLARKWRPRQFSEVVGQEHVLKALANGLDQQRVHHAFLFTGTRGVGKTTIARIFSKALNCEAGVSASPCGECPACKDINDGRFVDLIEIDAASRTGVDDIRDILDNVQYAPARGRYKVYLIDEVHMLSTHAFNALLKTLEEPPEHVKFLLATTDPQKLPVTVLSRCLQFHLRKLSSQAIQAHLENLLAKEEIVAEAEALRVLAHAAEGSVRDSLSLLDQAIAYGGGAVKADEVRAMLGTVGSDTVVNLLKGIAADELEPLLATVAELDDRAVDFLSLLRELAAGLQRLALLQAGAKLDDSESLAELVDEFDVQTVQLLYSICLRATAELDLAPDPRAGFEMTLLRMLAFQPARVTAGQAGKGRQDKAPVNTSTTAPSSTPAPTQTLTQTAEASVQPAAASTVEKPVTTTNQAKVGLDDWPGLIDQLTLSGMARELARHCTPAAQSENLLKLHLDSTALGLLNDRAKGRLQDALNAHLGLSLKLEIDLAAAGDGQVPSVEAAATPAQQAVAHQEQRLNAAEQAIANDPNVKRMQEVFGAEIQSGSVAPANP